MMTSRLLLGVIIAALAALGSMPAQSCEVEFIFRSTPGACTYALVAGTFNGWDPDPQTGWHMNDDNADGIWELTEDLELGSYEYKFVCGSGGGQTWTRDMDNPLMVDDGHGNFNSVLLIDCSGRFEVTQHQTSSVNRTFSAHLQFISSQGSLDAGSVQASVDWTAQAVVSIVGNEIDVSAAGLSDGIHDLRITARDTTGQEARPAMLKILINREADWSRDTLYFAMTDRFANGDPSNDHPISGVPEQANYRGGDFAGLLDKLQDGYFDDLGITAIWISWPGDNFDGGEQGSYFDTDDCGVQPGSGYPTQNVNFSAYHGYWPKELDRVEEHFGDMALLREVTDEAHRRGIRIMLDAVINHVHMDSPLYTDFPSTFFNTNPIEICQDINWQRPITCWFASYLPDIDYDNPRAIFEMVNMLSWWVHQTGCDGFRVDAVKHFQMTVVEALRDRVRQEFEQTDIEFYMVGEVFSGSTGDLTPFLSNNRLRGLFDFPANIQILQALARDDMNISTLHQNMMNIRQTYASAYNGFLMSTFLGNHDIARFISLAGGQVWCPAWDNNSHVSQGWRHPPDAPTNEDPYLKLRLAFAYIMTVHGIPLIYYGDEIGLPGAGDPDNRRMMEFDGLSAWEEQTRDFVSALCHMRRQYPVLGQGEMTGSLGGLSGDALAFGRRLGNSVAVVALNDRTGAASGNVPVASLGLQNGDTLTDVLGGGTVTVTGNAIQISLSGRQAVVYMNHLPPTATPTAPISPTPTRTPTMSGSPTVTPTPLPSGSPTATPTAGPSATPTNTPGPGTPSATPTPIPTNTPGPGTPTATPTQIVTGTPEPSPTPGDCPVTGVTLFMPDTVFSAGDRVYLNAYVCNARSEQMSGYPLFVLLEAGGQFWFAPAWGQSVGFYDRTFPTGETVMRVIGEFEWPEGAGQGAARFWTALTNPEITVIYGNYDHWDFQWE